MNIAAASYDHDDTHFRFKRAFGEGLRGVELSSKWEDRKPPLRPLWKDIAAGILGAILMGLVIFWTCIL